jgi:hypothetical protein
MNCKICKTIIEKASGEIKSYLIDEYEIIVRIRKYSPGNSNICDDCSRKLILKALEINELERITK